MSTQNQDPIERIEQIVVAGASALRESLGVPVTARDVQESSDAAAAPANGVTMSAPSDRGAIVISAASEELAAAGDPESILSGLVAQIAAAAGTDLAGDADVVDSIDQAGLDEPLYATFETTVDGTVVPMLLGVSSSLLDPTPHEAAPVSRAPLPDLGAGNGNGNGLVGRDMNVLSDVSMRVTVQLGHTELRVRELLGLGEGSVVELDQAPGTPVDILVNGTAVAKGDVVVVHDELGVRITEVLGHPE